MITGVVQGLTDIGVFEHASWNAGASGGGWYVLAHTLASLSNTQGMNSAESVFQDIRVRTSRERRVSVSILTNVLTFAYHLSVPFVQQRITSSIYGDFFEANEARMYDNLSERTRFSIIHIYLTMSISFLSSAGLHRCWPDDHHADGVRFPKWVTSNKPDFVRVGVEAAVAFDSQWPLGKVRD